MVLYTEKCGSKQEQYRMGNTFLKTYKMLLKAAVHQQ